MREAPKKIFVHIGTPKTGTTALQTFFANHTDLLAKNNIVYPIAGRRRNQHFYLAIPQVNNKKLVEQVWQSLYDELNTTQWDTAVISSERFSRESPSEIFKALECFNAEIHIVLFLRERKALLSSHYRTLIKSGSRVCCSADAFIPFCLDRSDVFDYDALITRWCHLFGSNNVLEHLEKPHMTLDERYRITKKDCGLVIAVPGQLGFQSDEDHKKFYGVAELRSLDDRWELVKLFSTPFFFTSQRLSLLVKQYCLVAIYKKR